MKAVVLVFHLSWANDTNYYYLASPPTLYHTATGLPPHIHSPLHQPSFLHFPYNQPLHQAHRLQCLHLLLQPVPLATRMNKCIPRTRSQQPTCNFLWGLKTPNSFQIPRDGAASFEHPHELPQPFTLLLQLLLLLLALLLGQTHWVHAEMENFGSAGVVVALGGRKKKNQKHIE